MKIDDALISKLQRLSNLRLSVEEQIKFKRDLKEIMLMLEKINGYDADSESMDEGRQHGFYREDDVSRAWKDLEALYNNDKHMKSGFFTVPKFLNPGNEESN